MNIRHPSSSMNTLFLVHCGSVHPLMSGLAWMNWFPSTRHTPMTFSHAIEYTVSVVGGSGFSVCSHKDRRYQSRNRDFTTSKNSLAFPLCLLNEKQAL